MHTTDCGTPMDNVRLRQLAQIVLPLALMLLLALTAVPAIDQGLLARLQWTGRPPRSDLLLLLRIWGSLWTWLLISLVLLTLRPKARPRRAVGWLISLAPLVSASVGGATAELLKLLLRRERPSEVVGYIFRPWQEQPWSTAGLGLPSSHAAVAFAGSAALAMLVPRLRWPALVVAIGCAYTRVAAGAHFPSDVTLGAVVGYLVGSAAMKRMQELTGFLSRPAANRSPAL